MISSKKELNFYIMADMMMNRGKFKWCWKDRLKQVLFPDYIMEYLKSLRYSQYYLEKGFTPLPLDFIPKIWNLYKVKKLGLKLGFSIGPKVFGYGLVIPHHGTIVVGGSNKIGNYAVLHTSTCITDNAKKIGNALYLSTGVKITRQLILGNNVSIAANSVVNKSFGDNLLLVGSPAVAKVESSSWYERDGKTYINRVQAVKDLKFRMKI